MSAGIYSFVIEQGATTDFSFDWKDSDGNKVDLTNFEACMQLKTDYSQSNGTTVLTLTSSIGDIYKKDSGSAFLSVSGSDLVSPLISGSVGVYIGYDATTALTGSTYYYDLELTDTSIKHRYRLVEGEVKINKQVTSANPL